jgi:3-hydroxyisobutyrate dehydrogenase
MIAVVEAFLLAEKLGIDRQRLFEIVSNASGQCWALTSYCPVPGPVPSSPANRDYQSDFTATAMLNDLTLAQHAAKGVGVKAPIGAAAAALYELYADHGGTETDFSGIIRFLRGPETADNRTE